MSKPEEVIVHHHLHLDPFVVKLLALFLESQMSTSADLLKVVTAIGTSVTEVAAIIKGEPGPGPIDQPTLDTVVSQLQSILAMLQGITGVALDVAIAVPAPGAAGVDSTLPITITFTKPPASVAVTLNGVAATVTLDATGTIATGTPATPLAAAALVNVTVDATDAAGVAMAQAAYTFTTK